MEALFHIKRSGKPEDLDNFVTMFKDSFPAPGYDDSKDAGSNVNVVFAGQFESRCPPRRQPTHGGTSRIDLSQDQGHCAPVPGNRCILPGEKVFVRPVAPRRHVILCLRYGTRPSGRAKPLTGIPTHPKHVGNPSSWPL